MILRRFNERGIETFHAYLEALRENDSLPPPDSLLESTEYSTPVQPRIELDDTRRFATRHEMAGYLYGLFEDAGLTDIEKDKGLWTWLAFLYFDQLRIPAAKRKGPGAIPRYIAEVGNYLRNYRHLVAGPFFAYRYHADTPERVWALLCNPPNTPGDFYEQTASRQELVTNAAIMEAATELYYDRTNGSLKRGAGGKGKGSARRLADMSNQFDVTYDLYGMRGDEFLAMLPDEFKKFKPDAPA